MTQPVDDQLAEAIRLLHEAEREYREAVEQAADYETLIARLLRVENCRVHWQDRFIRVFGRFPQRSDETRVA